MPGDKRRRVAVEHESNLCLGSICRHLVPEVCYERLVNYVTVNSSRHGKSPPKRGFRTMKEVKANTRHSVIKAEHLASNMNIGLEKVEQMMIATTQKGIQNAVHPITRQYRVYPLHLHKDRLIHN